MAHLPSLCSCCHHFGFRPLHLSFLPLGCQLGLYLRSHSFQPRSLMTQPPVALCQLQGQVHPPRCAQPGSFWPLPSFLASFQHMLPGSKHATPARASTSLPLPVGPAAWNTSWCSSSSAECLLFHNHISKYIYRTS